MAAFLLLAGDDWYPRAGADIRGVYSDYGQAVADGKALCDLDRWPSQDELACDWFEVIDTEKGRVVARSGEEIAWVGCYNDDELMQDGKGNIRPRRLME